MCGLHARTPLTNLDAKSMSSVLLFLILRFLKGKSALVFQLECLSACSTGSI